MKKRILFYAFMTLWLPFLWAGIFDNPTPTHEDEILKKKSEIIEYNKNALRQLESLHTQAFNSVWYSTNVTPQEVFNSFGTDACMLFDISSRVQDFLAYSKSDYMPMEPPYNYTLNEDCTVTVGEKKQTEISTNMGTETVSETNTDTETNTEP